uniref:Uncharacterized protein n=1 Tax=Avena sativa TaxID=4498 RepID=A0ACD5W4G2_AVESA
MSSSSGSPAQETSLSVVSVAAESGSYIFRIDGYSKTKGRLGVGSGITSPVFTVGGHGWQLKYYPDGWRTSESAVWISMALVLVDTDARGVTVSVTFSLLDEAGEPQQRLRRGFGAASAIAAVKNVPLGVPKFAYGKRLEESAYLKDDRLTVRCDVIVTGVFRPARAAVVPPSDIHRDLGRLLSSGSGADVVFEVGGETFAAHRHVLAVRSSVFAAELLGAMKEKTATRVRIDGMEAIVFKAMLHFIYTDSLPDQLKDQDAMAMAQHLLVAADMYDLQRLKSICEEKLRSRLSIGMVATTLVLAEQHGCHGLKQACYDFVTLPGNLKKVLATDGFEHLTRSCPSLIKDLFAIVAP